ncbi:gephyrin-like molybdotransferase Glp [Pseudoruegeria sp. HB172150]|uniref:molybdopterin molybdotransferase MoeA n=1 Tax=Pseudoruegeria sp. HB172150 TaxID=2721164 RepID=UPI00155308EC|nr:gephyrin-like molybdotransferase Glp [Pseudoruegeria sp. HB172150]
MITVAEALDRVFSLASPLGTETVPLMRAAGRVLATDAVACRDQPPFPSSAMDGYAVRNDEVRPGASFRVIGQSAAGHGFSGSVGAGEAVRIFTGAPVPEGADRVVIQEDTAADGDTITLGDQLDEQLYVRPSGGDFHSGTVVSAPKLIRPQDLSLLAAMNIAEVEVSRRPVVALIATGDELVMPGEDPGPDQIIASNTFGLKAMLEEAGAEARMLPIARDNAASLKMAFKFAEGADLIVTIGGASVGDHDLVAPVAEELGMDRAFYKIAMRPGKPLMAGKLGGAAMLGLPGNPVSSLVCGHVFLLPLVRAMLGLGPHPAQRRTAVLASDIGPNGAREHYMRAHLTADGIAPFDRQDSSLLTVLAAADALLIRPVQDGPRKAGETVDYIPL